VSRTGEEREREREEEREREREERERRGRERVPISLFSSLSSLFSLCFSLF
jgi:hypothetical protein